ncbi:MAG: ribosome assembly RNA-binding protein YhbY [Gammaproteobacteria bacterium]|nr:ribosome assembly RNA-binding protein YhbY [Gammaproteobacteria bacterium]MDH5303017.1 ribosome assembly RNA-binding protein YhbY [Gammaproteobacteria bacterium]MDH5321236.1 ribosome assembly RNA-binding protein YhbY [Gammaproteobacteria bacterium]
MALSESQKKYLRGLGHHLKPVVMIGESGLTESVLQEFATSIAHHELIKVSVRAGDRQVRSEIIASLCASGAAELVQRIGNIALMYRANLKKKKRIVLPG